MHTNGVLALLALLHAAVPFGGKPSAPSAVQPASPPCGPRDARQQHSPEAGSISQLSWIAGTWTGSSGSGIVEERWSPAGGGTMLATARTLRDGRMIAFEFLCISERGGTLVYSAMPNGRTPATDFTLREVTPDSVTFANPAHDFPKTIRYARLADGSLETTVAGDGANPQRVVLKRAR